MHSCILHNVSKQLAYHAYDRDILHEIFSVPMRTIKGTVRPKEKSLLFVRS